MHTDDGGLPPGDLYPAGFSLAPHPSFAPYDALPVVGAWRVRRPGLLGLCVTGGGGALPRYNQRSEPG